MIIFVLKGFNLLNDYVPKDVSLFAFKSGVESSVLSRTAVEERSDHGSMVHLLADYRSDRTSLLGAFCPRRLHIKGCLHLLHVDSWHGFLLDHVRL